MVNKFEDRSVQGIRATILLTGLQTATAVARPGELLFESGESPVAGRGPASCCWSLSAREHQRVHPWPDRLETSGDGLPTTPIEFSAGTTPAIPSRTIRMVVDREDPNWHAAAAHDGSPPRRAAVLETTSRDHQERLREVA